MSCRQGCSFCGELRAAALRIVGREGIEALTLERLSIETGHDEEEIERHYASAEACLIETYEEVSQSVLEDFRTAFEAVPGWRDALTAAAGTLLERMAAHPEEARLCFQEVLRADHELLRRRVAARRRMVDLFADELRRRRGQDDVSRVQLEMLIGAGFQAIATAVAENRVQKLPELLPELTSRAYVFEPGESILA